MSGTLDFISIPKWRNTSPKRFQKPQQYSPPISQRNSVQFSLVQDGIYALGKAHMRSNSSLRNFPNAAFETVAMFVGLTMALSRPFKEDLSSVSSFAEEATKTFVVLCTISSLVYCNSFSLAPHALSFSIFNQFKVLQFGQVWDRTPLFQDVHWLPVELRMKYKAGCLCFKVMTLKLCCYIPSGHLLRVYIPTYTLRSSSDAKLFNMDR